jgi:RNA polymerase sigma-70 factor (ECF subfamily)
MSQYLPFASDLPPGDTEGASGGTAARPVREAPESPVERGDLERLVADNLPQLREFVRKRAGARVLTRESASDVVQSACRAVLEAAAGIQWQGDAAFRSFLYTTTLRKLIDKQRFHTRRKRRVSAEVPIEADELEHSARADPGTPSQFAVRAESLDQLQQALDRLPPDQRELISMRRLFGLTTEEIASELEISCGAVRARLSRAMARLAAQMKHS